jgi:hypothetical protein
MENGVNESAQCLDCRSHIDLLHKGGYTDHPDGYVCQICENIRNGEMNIPAHMQDMFDAYAQKKVNEALIEFAKKYLEKNSYIALRDEGAGIVIRA